MDIVEQLRKLVILDEVKPRIEDLRRELNLQKQRCELWKENSVAGAEEIERLREALKKIAESEIEINSAQAYAYCVFVAEAALQQKDSEK